ncbi:DNA-binding protein BIN4 [Heracleum sosnowskyi]|uniref:DNA-binding protein BIN4 n=1 Tax=Heracleum sosnowskyi TaxID=360622 RepID=A0AAD8N9B7_9APIA|nr:DNA-binding protein BIN4 [Heracleum sosnowskyi]
MGNSSGDDSPDWLRSFQTPTKSGFNLPSSSELSLTDSDQNDNTKENDLVDIDDDDDDDDDDLPLQERYASVEKKPAVKSTIDKKRKRENQSPATGKKGVGRTSKQKTSKKSTKTDEPGNSVWMLLSDSESCPETSPVRELDDIHPNELSRQETSQYSDKKKGNVTILEETGKEASKQKSPVKKKTEGQLSTKKELDDQVKGENNDDMDVPEEVIAAKPAGPYASSSSLPLVLPEKVQRSKALVECEDESIDLSGDVGAVGRVVITDNQDMLLDLKGTIYKTTIVPSRTFCVVSFGQSEAKIEAIMNDFIQLTPQSNVYEAETMVEGTLDGFSFGSEDEAEDLPKATTNQNDQDEGAEGRQNAKGNGNAEKKTALVRKKGKSAGAKPPKKPKKKVQATKKTKAKK